MVNKTQIVNFQTLYVYGLTTAWASNTTLTLNAGLSRDSSDLFDILLPSAVTINAAINGANGLDTGTFAASKCYAVYLIADSSKYNDPKGLISLSTSTPTLPSGYDIYRRLGWAFSDGSTHFIKAYNCGTSNTKIYSFDEPVSILSGGTSATFAAIDLTNIVPAIDNLPIKLQLAFTPNAANDSAYVRSGGSSATNGLVMYGSVAAKISSQEADVISKMVITAPTIEYKVTASGSLSGTLLSFTDNI